MEYVLIICFHQPHQVILIKYQYQFSPLKNLWYQSIINLNYKKKKNVEKFLGAYG